jgi:putative endopeptidase
MQIQKNLQTQPQAYTAPAQIPGAAAEPAPTDGFSPQGDIPGFDLRNLDKSVDPGKDFYHYADGGWQKSHPIPDDKKSIGSFDLLAERNLTQVNTILQAAAADPTAAAGSPQRMIGDFYASGMDTATIDAAGDKPLAPEFDRIDKIQNLSQLQGETARLQGLGMAPFFSFSPVQDAHDSTKIIGQADQNGLGLPDRDYYLKTDDRSVAIRSAYVDHITKMFTLLGDDPEKAKKEAATVMSVETRLATNSLDNVASRDPQTTYNITDRDGLAKLTPNLDWNQYFTDRGRPDIKTINVAAPQFFSSLSKQLGDTPIEDLKAAHPPSPSHLPTRPSTSTVRS